MRFDPMLLALSSVGTLMGVLSLFGLYGPPVEFTLWAVWGLALWVPVVVARRTPRPFVALLIVGALAGLQTGIIQSLFAHVLVENNSAVYGSKDDAPARLMLLLSSTAAGTAQGIVTGLIALAIVRLRARRDARPTPSART